MRLPQPRGPLSETVVEALRRPPGSGPEVRRQPWPRDPVRDDDLQLALWTCYELHYRGFDGVDEDWEWEPGLLALRRDLEVRFEDGLRALVGPPPEAPADPAAVPAALRRLVDADDGPSLAGHLLKLGTLEQFRDMLVHRSVFHLKEADPHTWGIPRLAGRAKAALVEIQADEYGGGRPERVHQELFRVAMEALGLDGRYGAYVDAVPGSTLVVSNTQSLFGLHRRWLGALLGHLAAFESTSSIPNRRYGSALRRLDAPAEALWFFDEHVEADAVHEQLAVHDLCGSLAIESPGRSGDVLFGAACGLATDRLLAEHLLACWQRGVSSLRPATEAAA